MTELLENIGNIIANNFWLGLLMAFVGGILTFFTPCSMSGIPLLVSYICGTTDNKKKAFIYSLFICLGQTITFVTLGIVATLLGRLMAIAGIGRWWNVILALLMVFMAFETWGITHLLSKGTNFLNKKPKRGIWGAILVGIISAVFASPCSTPILTAMLAYVSMTGVGILQGGLLLLLYSIGHSILFVVAGTFLGFVQGLSNSKKFTVFSKVLKVILGLLMLALAGYLIFNAFYV